MTTDITQIKRAGTAVAESHDVKIDFFTKNGFELAMRISNAFATSDAVPAIFRRSIEKKGRDGSVTLVDNPSAMGNCLVAIEVSKSVGMSIVSVMQNADVIQGKLRWSSKFQIAAINASRRFSPLKFKLNNLGRIKATYKEKQGWNKQLNKYDFIERHVELDNWECIAWAYELDETGRKTPEIIQGPPVTMKMAVEEGWYAKDGSKWQGEMRFLMLQYRAGTFFGSIHAQDVIMGMGKTTEEEHDIIDVTPNAAGTFSPVNLQDLRVTPDAESETVNLETGEIHSAPESAPTGPSEEAVHAATPPHKPRAQRPNLSME